MINKISDIIENSLKKELNAVIINSDDSFNEITDIYKIKNKKYVIEIKEYEGL